LMPPIKGGVAAISETLRPMAPVAQARPCEWNDRPTMLPRRIFLRFSRHAIWWRREYCLELLLWTVSLLWTVPLLWTVSLGRGGTLSGGQNTPRTHSLDGLRSAAGLSPLRFYLFSWCILVRLCRFRSWAFLVGDRCAWCYVWQFLAERPGGDDGRLPGRPIGDDRPGRTPLSALVSSQTSSRGSFCALIWRLILAVFVVFVQGGGCNWREKLPVVQEVAGRMVRGCGGSRGEG